MSEIKKEDKIIMFAYAGIAIAYGLLFLYKYKKLYLK